MTTVRATPATPPPRLPVRDKASALDRGWGGVSPMLTRLAAERATGILVRERGTLHLADGKVVHAESPAAPGADVLLAAHGTLDPGIWRQALAESVASTGATGTGARRLTGAEAVHRAGRRLVAGGLLTPGALEMCRLTALYDAAYFALAPSSTPGRFRYSTEDGPDAPADVPRNPTAPPASRTPCRSPTWSARPCAGATCCTASGRTRCPTRCRWPGSTAPRPRRSRPGGGRCWPGSTASARRRRSHASWAARPSTPWWTYGGWWRPEWSRPACRRPSPSLWPGRRVTGPPSIPSIPTSPC